MSVKCEGKVPGLLFVDDLVCFAERLMELPHQADHISEWWMGRGRR